MSNQSTTNLQGTTTTGLSTCQICGHNVPTSNLILHEANCNRSSSTPSRPTGELQQEQSSLQQNMNSDTQIQQQQIDGVETVLQASQSRDIGQQIPNENDTSNMSTSYVSSTTTSQSPSDNNTQQATSTANNNNTQQATSIATASTRHDTIQLSENQWQCTRCTLINEQSDSNCAVCLAPRNNNTNTSITTVRPPDQSINQRLVGNNNNTSEQVVDNGWVNVTYNPQFQQNDSRTNNNGWVQQNTGRIGRILNGFVNGAVVGSFFAGGPGIIAGGIAGAVGGALVDRTNSTEDAETRNTHDVANMLATDNGGMRRNTMRVHRSSNYVTAVSRDRNGRNRIIRVRYGGGNPRRLQSNAAQSDLERSLLEVLVNMSHSRDFGGPMNRNNIILQPEQSFEELIQQFGMGNENRGASQEVIDSYPVEVVRKQEDEMDIDIESEGESIEDGSDEKMEKTNANEELISLNKAMEIEAETSDLGTCGICLEDYNEGDMKKTLSCKPMAHSFHSECINKWLKQVASCPTCKHDVSLQT